MEYFSIKNHSEIDKNQYVNDNIIRCQEIINCNTCTHESLIDILNSFSDYQLSIIGF